MSLLFTDTIGKYDMALSAVAGVLLVLLVSWTVWRKIGHTRLPGVQSSAQPTNHASAQHEAVSSTQSELASVEKHTPAGEHKHHHRHAKSVSSRSHGSHSTHDHHGHGETEQLLQPRAHSQPDYSGHSHHEHSHREDSAHSSRILPLHDTHDEPASMPNHHHVENTDLVERGQSGRPDGSSHHSTDSILHLHSRSHSNSSDHTAERHASANVLRERLQENITTYLRQHPEPVDEPEDISRERMTSTEVAPNVEIPGKRYRDAALQEARRRKEAYENSKKAFKMGRKAEAKQLSDRGKLHDENAKRYNALAAQEVFNANNPRYYQGRQLSRCDLHGLHVEEAMAYARDHIVACRSSGTDKTMLIVGRGSHSQGSARIKPAILSMLSQTGGILAGLHEKNEGCIVVEFAVGR